MSTFAPARLLASRRRRVASRLEGGVALAEATLGRGTIGGLDPLHAGEDPIALFEEWFGAAAKAGIYLPEAMTLATATPEGVPSARMVLLKRYDRDGFVFFTNFGSRKAVEMDANPRAALCMHWAVLQRQVRIEGPVSRISEEASTAYFRTRPRGSDSTTFRPR